MRPAFYGYRLCMRQASIHPEEAAIVRAILYAEKGKRVAAVRAILDILDLSMAEDTIKKHITCITKKREFYRLGKPAKNLDPKPELIIS